MRYLESIGAYYVPVVQNRYSRAGVMDGIVCYKGMFIGLEFKAPGKRVDDQGQQMIQGMAAIRAGGLWFQVDRWSDVPAIIDRIDRGEITNDVQRTEYREQLRRRPLPTPEDFGTDERTGRQGILSA